MDEIEPHGKREMKNEKASDPGNISVELLKHWPDILTEILASIEIVIEGHIIPADWNLAYLS